MFWDQLHMRARPSIRELVESGATTGFGGGRAPAGGGALCGHRQPPSWPRAGPGPSVDELVEFHNERMRNGRADAIKQGALLSPGGLVENGSSRPTQQPAGDLLCRGGRRAHTPLLARAPEEILVRCEAVSPRTGQVPRAYAAAALADPPTTASSLGTRLGWSEATILRGLHTVKRIARQVLRQHGVCVPTAV